MSTLLAILVLFSIVPAGEPAGRQDPTGSQLHWSDPATWDGDVPSEGEVVTIPANRTILLDVSPPPLGGLAIEGTLRFDERDLLLRTEWIVVRGRLQIGSESDPFDERATIALLNRAPGEDVLGFGDRVIVVAGGEVELHGEMLGPTWTRLAATARPGDHRILLEEPVEWRPGDRIVLASTDFDAHQAEERTIAARSGDEVTLDRPLDHLHWGEDAAYGDFTLSERAEVGLLSRSIQVLADPTADADGRGGHLIVVDGAARIAGVEFTRMGQRGELARYPIHFHLLGDAPTSYVRQSSIHHTYNRCLTIHGTNQVRVEGNVAYNAVGHCYFLEDGAETGNTLTGNLGILTRAPATDDALLPTDLMPATFWITNPDNVLRGNVAAGSDGFGFWYALPEHPTGHSQSSTNDATVWPRRTPLGEFRGNVAHSNAVRGLNVDDGPTPDGTTELAEYTPRRDPIPPADGENDSASVTAEFVDFTAYKNRERAIWVRGSDLVVSGAVLADNAIGVTLDAQDSSVEDSLIVGESANLGEPGPLMPAGQDGRGLPIPWDEAFRVRGFDFYGGVVGVRRVSFAGFFANDQRPASALGFNTPSPFAFNPANFAEGITWLDDSDRVYIAEPYQGYDGDELAVFVDRDGSVTGRAGQSVGSATPFLDNGACEFKTDWNAAVCDGGYGALVLQDPALDSRPIAPVTLTRDDGVSIQLDGYPDYEEYQGFVIANVIPGSAYEIDFGDEGPAHLRLYYAEATASSDSTILVSFPWTGPDAFVYSWLNFDPDNALKPATDVADLVESKRSGYVVQNGTIYLKLTPNPLYDAIVLDLCQRPSCI